MLLSMSISQVFLKRKTIKTKHSGGLPRILLLLLCLFALVTDAFSYDFYERSRGQLLFFNILSAEEHTCEVTFGDPGSHYEGSYTIPRSVRHQGRRYQVTAVGKRAFKDCTSLTGITIPANITRIDSAAFSGCSGIYRLRLPKQLTYLGEMAFYGCSALSYVEIPASVGFVGAGAFGDCESLMDINVADGNTRYSDMDGSGCVVDLKTHVLVQASGSAVIPKNVVEIGAYAFSGRVELTSVNIPDRVTTISAYAFYGCRQLREVRLPQYLSSIGSRAFFFCSILHKVTADNPVPSPIATDAFQPAAYERVVLTVPVVTDEAYRSTEGWGQFRQILTE